MSTQTAEAMGQDRLAMAVAAAVAVANQTAVREGTSLSTSLLTVTEVQEPSGRFWRVHYGPRDYVNRRGGDLIVLVEEATGSVKKVLRGQ